MRRNKAGSLPTVMHMCVAGPLDDDERWKGAQRVDAKNGIYWGKYGRMIHEKTKAEEAADKYHAHLDECEQCEEHPFDQCPTGARLLQEFGEKNEGERDDG